MQFDEIDSLVAYAANTEQMTLCGTNLSVNPTAAAILSLDFTGSVKWYNTFEQVLDDK